jgi:hypothetical protein
MKEGRPVALRFTVVAGGGESDGGKGGRAIWRVSVHDEGIGVPVSAQ